MNAKSRRTDFAALETSEIPTLIFGARTHLAHAAALIIRLTGTPDDCRRWLQAIEPHVTFGHERASQAAAAAFTATGLANLGHGDCLGVFPVAFQSGMTAPGRTILLGDKDRDAPENWDWGFGDNQCDAILILYAETPEAVQDLIGQHNALLAPAGALIGNPIILPSRDRQVFAPPETTPPGAHACPRHGDGRGLTTEPFGFADGISQPIIRGTPRAAGRPARELSPAGAFILGYETQPDGSPSLSPLIARDQDPAGLLPTVTGEDAVTRADLGRNGTFLVVRQLQQDVGAFKEFALATAADPEMQKILPSMPPDQRAKWIEAKLIGRWQNGASLVRHPDHPGHGPDNDFLFRAEDASGLGCPLGAHIRRANPRDSLTSQAPVSSEITGRHRLLRVGRPYAADTKAPDDKPEKNQKRGILFMCLNADIETQFETVQQSWLKRHDFHGLRNESDPLTAPAAPGALYTIPTRTGPVRLKNLPDFVNVIGGGYFFMPSRAAIRFLAATPP